MFSVDLTRTWVDPAEGEVVGLIASLNQPLVQAAPDRPTEPTQAYVITRQLPAGFDVLVYFHLLDSNVAVIYSNDESPVPADDLMDAQDEAQDLVLSMGFLLENRDIEALEGGQRSEVLAELPPFHADLSPFAREEEAEKEEKKEVNEVDEFRRAREALAESGQDDAARFVPEPTDSEFQGADGLPLEPSMPVVQGVASGDEDLPDASDLLEMSNAGVADADGIVDIDALDLTGELEAIPDRSAGGALDALLDEVEVDGPVPAEQPVQQISTAVAPGMPPSTPTDSLNAPPPPPDPLAAPPPPPALEVDALEPLPDAPADLLPDASDALIDTIEPLEDVPAVGTPVPPPMDVDELLDEVSKPGPGINLADDVAEPSFVDIGSEPTPGDDMAEVEDLLDSVFQPDEASSIPEVSIDPDLMTTDSDMEVEVDEVEVAPEIIDTTPPESVEIEASDVEIGEDDLDDIEIPMVEPAAAAESPFSLEGGDKESLGDNTMAALLDAVDDLEPEEITDHEAGFNQLVVADAELESGVPLEVGAADDEDDDFQVEVSLDDDDMFAAPDELVADGDRAGANGASVGNGIDTEAAAAIARDVEAADLVRLLSLL